MSLKRAKHKQASELFADALACFADFPPKNREKLIDFVFNLVETGNKSQSALKAGLGNTANKNKTPQQELNLAATEADRYLKNPKVLEAYKVLQRKRDMQMLSDKLGTKENTISLLNQIAIKNVDFAPSAAQKAIVEAAKMKGYYIDTDAANRRPVNNINLTFPQVPVECDDEKKRIEALGFQEVSAEEDAAITKDAQNDDNSLLPQN